MYVSCLKLVNSSIYFLLSVVGFQLICLNRGFHGLLSESRITRISRRREVMLNADGYPRFYSKLVGLVMNFRLSAVSCQSGVWSF